MSSRYFKIIITTPSDDLRTYLQKNLLFHNLDLVHLPDIAELPHYQERFRAHMVILYVDPDPARYQDTVEVIRTLHDQYDQWFLLMVDPRFPMERFRADLPRRRVFLQKYDGDFQQVIHNILTIKDIEQRFEANEARFRFESNFNHCLQLIYQEKALDRIFERLVTYFPKVILMDYWCMFTLTPHRDEVDTFAQFLPPTRRRPTTLTDHLPGLEALGLSGGSVALYQKRSHPEIIQRFGEWGWPVVQVYFLPIRVREQLVGGLLVGHGSERSLQPEELQFLNHLVEFLARRILSANFTDRESRDITDFSDQIISNQLEEDAIFQHACRKLTEITSASSTTYWQNNKGFGFLFPKFVHFRERAASSEGVEKNMIFLNRDGYFNQLVLTRQIQSFSDIASDERFDAATREIFAKLNYRHVLVIPVTLHGEVAGTLFVNKGQPRGSFDVWEIHKAEEILKRLEKSIEDARTVKEANFQLRQLGRIFELGNEIKLDLSLREILDRIARSVRKALGWNDVAILVRNDAQSRLEVLARIGFDQKASSVLDFNKGVADTEFDEILANSETISHSFFFSPRKGDGAPPRNPDAIEWEPRELLVVSLETRGRVLGYLLVHDPVDRLRPTVDKVVPLEYYANQAAVAVENVVLYEQLRTSQERYRSLAETMTLGLVTCDQKRRMVYVNPAFRYLVGFETDELAGSLLLDFFSQKSRKRLTEVIEALLSPEDGEDNTHENMELELVSGEGEKIPVSAFGFPLYERRRKTGFFLVLNDLRLLKRLERMKADFNSMIVHDLRSPMNVIQGFIELIRNRVVGEINSEQEELLDIAKENVKKVLTLIDNFLIASKLDVGKFSIDPKLDEINTLVERQVANHQVMVRNKKIELSLDLDRNLPLLLFDSLRIEQVLNNLISNALKFTPENGTITVETSLVKQPQGDEAEKFFARVSVRDSGVGIPVDKLKNIFEKYEQVDDNQQFNIRGTGLGLSICKEIVDLHGGEIWAESEEKMGSTFSFTLPIEPTIEKIVN